MAKGQKTGGKDFPPGVSGNPKGRPPIPADLRAAREMRRNDLLEILTRVIKLTKCELRARFRDANTPADERMIIQLVRSATWGGNVLKIGFIMKQLTPAPAAGDGLPGTGGNSFADLMLAAEKARRGKK